MTHVPSTDGPVYDQRCTTEERRLLDILAAAEQPPEPDMAATLALVDAQEAVIDAACAETDAEAVAREASRRALQARAGSPVLVDEKLAHRRLAAARVARRNAVARLRTLKAQQ